VTLIESYFTNVCIKYSSVSSHCSCSETLYFVVLFLYTDQIDNHCSCKCTLSYSFA